MKLNTLVIMLLILLTACEDNSTTEKDVIADRANEVHNVATEEVKEVEDVEVDDGVENKTNDENEANTEDTLPFINIDEDMKGNLTSEITNSVILEEISNNKYNEEEIAYLEKFMGLWTYRDEDDLYMDLHDNVELVGVRDGQLMTRGEFSVTEVNIEEQFIIIHVFSEEVEYHSEESSEKQELYSKLFLKSDGKELLYVNDYLGNKLESTWIR